MIEKTLLEAAGFSMFFKNDQKLTRAPWAEVHMSTFLSLQLKAYLPGRLSLTLSVESQNADEIHRCWHRYVPWIKWSDTRMMLVGTTLRTSWLKPKSSPSKRAEVTTAGNNQT